MTLVKFKDTYQASVYVNPALVTYIKESAEEKTDIHFDHNHNVTVAARVDMVASELISAGPTPRT